MMIGIEFMSLATPQCSTGTTQSRPFPARAGKLMESAGQYTRQNAAGGSGGIAEKQNASGEISHRMMRPPSIRPAVGLQVCNPGIKAG